jgi:hypothetical protein
MSQAKTKPLQQADEAPKPFLTVQAQNRILWILFGIWAILVCTGIAYHEQWRDEGSDWLTVRHVSIGELFIKLIPQIGHPPMWYFLMYPLGNMGLPLVTVNIVCAVVMALALYLMLFKLKFPFYLKLALIFSSFFLYEYPVVGRNYCLVVLFLMLTLYWYPKRFEKPLMYALILIGLFNTHSMVFPMAFGMLLLYCWELVEFKKLNVKTGLAAVLIAIGGAYLIPYMALPGLKAVSAKLDIPDHFLQFKTAVGNGLLVGGIDDPDTLRSLALLFLVSLLLCLVARLKPLAVLLCGAGGLMYLLTYKYIGQHRHHGLLMVEILFAYGLAPYYIQDRFTIKGLEKLKTVHYGTIILAVMLAWQSYMGFLSVQYEIDHQFSDSKSAAEFLKDNNLEHKILVGHQSWAASAVLQHLPADCKMYWADTKRWGYYIPFDSLYMANQYKFPMGDYAAVVAEHQFKDSISQVVLVLNFPIQTPQIAALWKPEYTGGMWAGDDQKPMKSQESFIIYVRNPQYPTAVEMPPVDSLFKAP